MAGTSSSGASCVARCTIDAVKMAAAILFSLAMTPLRSAFARIAHKCFLSFTPRAVYSNAMRRKSLPSHHWGGPRPTAALHARHQVKKRAVKVSEREPLIEQRLGRLGMGLRPAHPTGIACPPEFNHSTGFEIIRLQLPANP